MTINGTNKTAISLLLLVGTGYLTFNNIVYNTYFCGIGGFIIPIITVFKKNGLYHCSNICHFRRWTVRWGSFMYNSLYDGIVTNAIFLTVGILLSLLTAYRSGYIKPTENFKLGIFAATGDIAIVYLINFVMSFLVLVWGLCKLTMPPR